MKPVVLRVEKLSKILPEGTLVDNVSFELHQGEIVGLLGPNGAGKTMIIQMLLSTMTPTSGTIYYWDKNLQHHRSEILQHVAFASSYVRLPGRLTVLENLDFFAQIYGISRVERYDIIKKLLRSFDLWHARTRATATLSAGESAKLMLVKAFITKPQIVLLDEPSASLDPEIAHEIRQFILHQSVCYGISILFTSHNMDEVTLLCDKVLVLKEGNIIARNTPEQLAAQISLCKLQLLVGDMLLATQQCALDYNLKFKIEGHAIIITLDEYKIAEFLMALANRNIKYSQISVDKPTLEDYFLHIAK